MAHTTNATRVLISIDPGVSTGIVVATIEPDNTVEIKAFSQEVHEDLVMSWHAIKEHIEEASTLGPVEVVAEQFDLRPQNKFIANLTPVKLNALLTVYCAEHNIPIYWQTPAQAKSLVKDSTLKNLGWYLTGKHVSYKDANDVRDAFRHLVYRLAAQENNKWVIDGGWPR